MPGITEYCFNSNPINSNRILNFMLKTILLICFAAASYGQQTIDFSSFEKAENIDFNSLYPALILKHNIGRFYKLPKNPVLSPTRNSWDADDTADPFVYVTADSIYLFYDGSRDVKYSIGYAVRTNDGWGWQKRKQILVPDFENWRSFHLIAPLIVPNTNLLIYNGNSSDSELGYQTGIAGKSNNIWHFLSGAPHLKRNNQQWDFAGNAYQDVVYLPSKKKYLMFYSGFTGPLSSIGLAESSDGINWLQKEEPVLKSPPGVIAPTVIFNGEKFLMYYVQLDINKGYRTFINSAVSSDGLSWQKRENILKPDNRWEGTRLMRPNLSYFENQYHLFYCAQYGSHWQIGEAIADASFSEKGDWLSKRIAYQPSEIIIRFEQPASCALILELLDENLQVLKEIKPLDDKEIIRNGVYRSTIKTSGINFSRIRIKFNSNNRARSPLIYSISLK